MIDSLRDNRFFLAQIFLLCLCFLPNYGECADSKLELANENGDIIFIAPIIPEKGFAIRYIHSVALTPVVDYFLFHNNEIILDRTEYQDFGAGLPHSPEMGQAMRTKDGKIIISNIKKVLPQFQLRVGRIANHTLIIPVGNSEGIEIPLKKIAAPGAAITFKAKVTN